MDKQSENKKQPPEIIEIFSPTDGKKVGEVKSYSFEEARTKLAEVRKAQKVWGQTSLTHRRDKLLAFLEALYRHADELAELITLETGKTRYEASLFEIAPMTHLISYFANKAEKILKPRKISISVFKNRASYIHYKGRGVVLVISPWNFPMTIPIGEVVIALMAGNGVLLKPASLTPLIAVKIRELFDEAGIDEKLFQVIPGPGHMASKLIEEGVDYVNFTGSTDVGKKVAEICGRNMIPCSMELGGKDPAIVCADANLAAAVKSVVWGAFSNSGQICASVERVYVHESLYDLFVEKATHITKALCQGNPTKNSDIDIGAMTDSKQIEVIEKQIEDAVKRGGKIITGGKRAKCGDMYFEPTIITDVDENFLVVKEESFGPILPIMKFKNEQEAIAKANDSIFGLTAYVFSQDVTRAKKIAEQLDAGTVTINDVLVTHSYPETPWGGVKESGLGRVHSDDGLRDLSIAYHVNYNTISMDNPLWYPYSVEKIKMFISGAELMHRRLSISEKIKRLKNTFRIFNIIRRGDRYR